ncbi:VENN motif pre-toxin domain-containing protein, partial [Neisseria dentiae]|uniref:VENN motif pre-toxin domain-containing protein n=1 Tax=Neisseria dentiae TaxID=194197 RepID=UPI00211C54F9
DGAIGAAVGEIVGEALTNGKTPAALTAKEREQILAYSKLVAGTVSGVTGGDVNTAANAAKVTVENNLFGGSYGSYRAKKSEEELRKTDPRAYEELKQYQMHVFNEAAGMLFTPYGVASDYSKADTLSSKAFALASFIPGEKILAKGYKGAKALFEKAADLYKRGNFEDAYFAMKQGVRELKEADVLYAVTPEGSRVKISQGTMPDHAYASRGSTGKNKDLYIGSKSVDQERFHRVIKPAILKLANKHEYVKKVGTNPDISIEKGKIILIGSKQGPFKGQIYKTDLDASKFFD